MTKKLLKKRKPDLCNPTLVRFSMLLVYQYCRRKSREEVRL